MDKKMTSALKNPEYIVDFSKDPLDELEINLYYNNA